MVGHKRISWPGTMRDFAFSQTYTRGEIRQALGGDLSSYLPHRDGRVVCGCFRPDLNPDAPDVILPGRGPKIERWARVFATQRDFIPCFVKADTNAWEYVGRFRVRRVAAKPDPRAHALADVLGQPLGRASDLHAALLERFAEYGVGDVFFGDSFREPGRGRPPVGARGDWRRPRSGSTTSDR